MASFAVGLGATVIVVMNRQFPVRVALWMDMTRKTRLVGRTAVINICQSQCHHDASHHATQTDYPTSILAFRHIKSICLQFAAKVTNKTLCLQTIKSFFKHISKRAVIDLLAKTTGNGKTL